MSKREWRDSEIDGIALDDGGFVVHHTKNDDAWIEARYPLEIKQ